LPKDSVRSKGKRANDIGSYGWNGYFEIEILRVEHDRTDMCSLEKAKHISLAIIQRFLRE
jgi:hypothetical protein